MKLFSNVMMMALIAGSQLWAADSKIADGGQVLKLRVLEGRPIVDGVFVNGHGPFRFLIDTGSNVNLIENGLAQKIGMIQAFQIELTSSAGKTFVSGSDDNEVTLGPAKAGTQKFLFSGLEAIHNVDPTIQGVLGQWFLVRFDYSLDLRGKRLEFGKQDLKGTRTPFKMVNGRMVVSSSLGDFVLDAGSARLILFGMNVEGGKGFVRTVAGSESIGLAPGETLNIEGRNFWHGDAVTMPNRNEPGVAGLLPVGLFKAIYVCNSEGYVVLD